MAINLINNHERDEGSGYDSTPFLDTKYEEECHVERTGLCCYCDLNDLFSMKKRNAYVSKFCIVIVTLMLKNF